MIEVLRQTLGELANSLALLGFIMPETVMTQLDNCYENKNQFVFAFFSIMVETKQIKTVELHFLLVGHTHCSVDQYFSVLSKVGRLIKPINFDGITHSESLQKLALAHFIATPLSMEAFLAQAHGTLLQRPKVSRLLDVVYDFVGAMKPFICQEIKFFSVPHYYRLTLFRGKCIAEYKIRSTTNHLMPRRHLDGRAVQNCASILVPDDFVFVDGKAQLLRYLDVPADDTMKLTADQMQMMTALESVNHIFSKLQQELFAKLDKEVKMAGDEGPITTHAQLKRDSDNTYGYICWLKDSVDGTPFRIPVVYPIIHGDEEYGGNEVQRAKSLTGAQEMFAASNKLLESVGNTFSVRSEIVFDKDWFTRPDIYKHEVDYLLSLGTEDDILLAAANKARAAPAWGNGFIYPQATMTDAAKEEHNRVCEAYASRRRIGEAFIASLVKKGQAIEYDVDGNVIEQVARMGRSLPVPAQLDWSQDSFQG